MLYILIKSGDYAGQTLWTGDPR